MQKEYRTVLKEAVVEIEEKKSRFIASVKPISSEEEALEFINSLKSKYWDATHNVYAYYIGGNNIIQRFSDDGEPSGTAGMPVLEVIRRMHVQDLAVVVTRYFGGTLLGASGLIRTYGKSAAQAIESAVVVKRQLCSEISLIAEYTLFGRLQNVLHRKGFAVKEIIYNQDVEIIVYIPVDEADSFLKLVGEATNARVLSELGKEVYITLDENGRLVLNQR